jgi:HAMP domain-containing protein
MKLRYKFGVLALFYLVTLAANVVLCSWCLLLYYQSFLTQGAVHSTGASPALATGDDIDGSRDDDMHLRGDKRYIVRILMVNAVCGVALGMLGLRLVRRWVMQPVGALRDTAVRIGGGDMACPVPFRSTDELGDLAAEVGAMASSILAMQTRLVEEERRQASVQALRCIVHNIRSPLTGIRWVAEAVVSRNDIDASTLEAQSRIIAAVDETLTWLQEYRESFLSDERKQEQKVGAE